MSARLEFHPEAAAEFDAALRYYGERREGLAASFLAAVRAATDLAAATPLAGHAFSAGARRLLVPGFPYAVLYAVEPDVVFVLAVAHTRRRPGYWRGRGR